MRLYNLPTGHTIDLDQVIETGPLFVNKNYPLYNGYEIYLANGSSVGVFDNDLPRASFLIEWQV